MKAFRLVRGDSVLGKVTVDDQDMWYFTGRFSEPTPEFVGLESLFDDTWIKEGDDRQMIWREITDPEIRLEPLDGGRSISLYAIRIRGSGEVSGRVR